jgi:hypothetical protein
MHNKEEAAASSSENWIVVLKDGAQSLLALITGSPIAVVAGHLAMHIPAVLCCFAASADCPRTSERPPTRAGGAGSRRFLERCPGCIDSVQTSSRSDARTLLDWPIAESEHEGSSEVRTDQGTAARGREDIPMPK